MIQVTQPGGIIYLAISDKRFTFGLRYIFLNPQMIDGCSLKTFFRLHAKLALCFTEKGDVCLLDNFPIISGGKTFLIQTRDYGENHSVCRAMKPADTRAEMVFVHVEDLGRQRFNFSGLGGNLTG